MKKTANNIIAVFDFDGTITRKDTLFDFIRFYCGTSKLIIGLIILFPILLSYKLKIISNSKAKQKLFSFFFKGDSEERFNDKCVDYISGIDKILNDEAIKKILWHQAQEHTVIINSASIENWIIPWAKVYKIDQVVATRIEINNGAITGRLLGNNCYGEEKVNRLKQLYPDCEKYVIYAYGDSKGDLPLLSIADHSFFRSF